MAVLFYTYNVRSSCAMAIIGMSEDLGVHAFVSCIICKKIVSGLEATAGSVYADGRQAFACNKHLRERTRWISAWATFNAHQQRLLTTQYARLHTKDGTHDGD
jgi:hypothetical protein